MIFFWTYNGNWLNLVNNKSNSAICKRIQFLESFLICNCLLFKTRIYLWDCRRNLILFQKKKLRNKAFTASNLKYSMTGKKNSKRGSVTKSACAFFEIESQSKTGYEIYPCVTQSVGCSVSQLITSNLSIHVDKWVCRAYIIQVARLP